MQRFLIALILLLSFDGQAVVRLMPRNDYEHIGPVRPFLYPKELLNLTNGIDDFFSGVRDLLSDQHIGGDFDLVYQEDQTLTHIYSCPSIRFCMKDKLPGSTPTDNTPSSPLAALFHISMPAVSSKMTAAEPSTNDQQLIMVDLDNTENAQLSSCLDPNKHPEAWQCKELIVAPKEVMCQNFNKTYKYLLIKNWFISNAVEGIIEAPIRWINIPGSIQFWVNIGSAVYDAGDTAVQVHEETCASASLDLTQAQFNNSENKKVILVQTEENKEDISYALTSFSKNTHFLGKLSNMTDSQKLAYGGYYQTVVLNPLQISDSGFVPEKITSPVLARDEKAPIPTR